MTLPRRQRGLANGPLPRAPAREALSLLGRDFADTDHGVDLAVAGAAA